MATFVNLRQCMSRNDIVDLLENDISDFSDDGEDSEPDFTGNQSDSASESDHQIDTNSGGATQINNNSWKTIDTSYVPNKFSFSGNSGCKKSAATPLEAFLLFFDEEIIDIIVTETNRYAEQKKSSAIWKPRSRVNLWSPVSSEEIHVYLGLIMLMGIVQKPSIKAYFSKNPILESPIFGQIITQDRFELISKFLHFVDNSTLPTFSGPKKLFKIHSFLKCINEKFQALYIPGENIAIDESLTLWKGRLSFKIFLPLKSSKFGIKTFELCESSTGYLWNFIVYSGSETELETAIDYGEKNKTSSIVVKLAETLLNKGHTIWMDNYYNSPDLARFLQFHGTNVAGTLRLNRKNVPAIVKSAKLKGEVIAQHSDGIMVMKWKDKKDVSMISTFHNASMESQQKRGVEVKKPTCVVECNKQMGAVDLKDQKLQPYLLERNRGSKWYIKLFKRLVNVAVHNALVLHNDQNSKMEHLTFRLQLITSLFERYGSSVHSRKQGRPSINPHPSRLIERHFIEKIPACGKKAKPQKRCVVCQKHGKRRDMTFWCEDCKVGLCLVTCFKDFHTEENF